MAEESMAVFIGSMCLLKTCPIILCFNDLLNLKKHTNHNNCGFFFALGITNTKKKKNEKNVTTLPETNIAPENGWLEYYFPIGEAYFQGLR